MKKEPSSGKNAGDLDQLIDEILVDAHGDDMQLWAFRQALEDGISLPCDAFVIGEPVSVTAFDYDGNPRRGLTAKCQREDGSKYVVAAADVVLSRGSAGARHLAAYRKWLGLEPLPPEVGTMSGRKRQHKAAASDLDITGPIELVALSVKDKAARCRLLGSERVLTLRASRLWRRGPSRDPGRPSAQALELRRPSVSLRRDPVVEARRRRAGARPSHARRSRHMEP